MPQNGGCSVTRNLNIALLCFFVSWAAYGVLHVYPGYVHQDTAEVYMWSQIGYLGGFTKHPPLMAWLFRAVDSLVPLNFATLALLSAANLTIGAFAVCKIAERVVGPERTPAAMLLYMLTPFVTWQAIKLNHNSILVSFWPLAILAFLMFRERPTIARGALLGLIAGLAILAKYYAVLLVAAMAVVLLPSLLRYLASPGTYVGILAAGLVLAPHALWVFAHPGGMATGAGGAAEPGTVHLMLTRNLLGLLPVLVGFLVLRYGGRGGNGTETSELPRRDEWGVVVILFVVPYVLTVAANILFGLRGSASWTMPIFTIVPVILAGLLVRPAPAHQARIAYASFALLALVLMAGPVIRYTAFKRGDVSLVDPRIEIAEAADRLWGRVVPAQPLRVVAGDHQYVMQAAVSLPSRPRGWTVFAYMPFIPQSYIDANGFVAICEPVDAGCRKRTAEVTAGKPAVTCTVAKRRTLWGQNGREFQVVLTLVPPPGHTLGPATEKVCSGL